MRRSEFRAPFLHWSHVDAVGEYGRGLTESIAASTAKPAISRRRRRTLIGRLQKEGEVRNTSSREGKGC